MPPSPPPHGTEAPGKRGYWWSGGLVLTVIVLITAIYLFGLNPRFPGPDIAERFDSDEYITFEFEDDEDGRWALYHSSGGSYVALPCSLHSPDGERVSPSDDGWYHGHSFGGWGAVGPLETPEPGTYTVYCRESAEEYALGDTGPLKVRNAVFAGIQITALGIIPALLLAAVVVGVVTALRRRSARKPPPVAQAPAPHAAPPQQYPSPQSPHQQSPHQQSPQQH